MKDFSVSMALVDYIPVMLFAAAVLLLMRDLYEHMRKDAFALFAAGSIDIVCAGALKATYKLLYAAGICDFEALNAMFFPVQSLGFLMAGVGMVLMLCGSKKHTVAAVAPPLFTGTFVFVGLMVTGLGMVSTVLCILAARLKKVPAMVCFIVAFVCSMCMGYLSSQDFTQAFMNWMAEIINIVGQGALLTGTVILHKAGLAQISLKKG